MYFPKFQQISKISKIRNNRIIAYHFGQCMDCGDALLIIANVPVLVISSFKGAWIGGVPGKKLIRKDTDLNKHGILQIYT
jgi:hypothetical protein